MVAFEYSTFNGAANMALVLELFIIVKFICSFSQIKTFKFLKNETSSYPSLSCIPFFL